MNRIKFIVAVSFALCLAPTPCPAGGSDFIIVLDASGSMWGQVENQPKIEIARDVIEDLVKDWDEGIRVGLSPDGYLQFVDA